MKTIKLKQLVILTLAIVGFAIITQSCEGLSDVTKKIEIEVTNDIFDKQVVIQVFDPANQKNLEGTGKIFAEILGEDSDKIVGNAGERLPKKINIVNGIIALAVNPNKASKSQTVKFIVRVSGKNYLTTTLPVVLDKNSGNDEYVSINLINKKSTPKGVDLIKKKNELTSDGKIKSKAVIKTETQKAHTSTKIEIEEGTEFLDEKKNKISGKSLETELTHFSTDTYESMASFPGGYTPQITDSQGNTQNNVYFITAGFASINMNVGGKTVKNFSKPINITMEVGENYINPDTGKKIKAGDVIPVWSYSKDDGTWDYHKKGVITIENNKPVIKFKTTHLSWYSLCEAGILECLARFESSYVRVTTRDSRRSFVDVVYSSNGQPFNNWSGQTVHLYNGSELHIKSLLFGGMVGFPFVGFPPDDALRLVIYSGSSRYNRGERIFTSKSFRFCGGNSLHSINLNDALSKLPKGETIKIDYKGKCGNKMVAPSMNLFVRDIGIWFYVGYVDEGKITLYDMELGKPYTFAVYYNGKFHEHTMTFNKTTYINDNYKLPDNFCNNF